MPAPDFDLVLCGQVPRGDDAATRFAEEVRYARDAGFDSVWVHHVADPHQYPHQLAVLSRIVPESGQPRIEAMLTRIALDNPVDLADKLATPDLVPSNVQLRRLAQPEHRPSLVDRRRGVVRERVRSAGPGRPRVQGDPPWVHPRSTGEPPRASGAADLPGRTPKTSPSVHSVLKRRGKRSPLRIPRLSDALGDPRSRGGPPCIQ